MKSQEKTLARNSIYSEVLGNSASFLSINYDRILIKKEKISLSVAIGAGIVPANQINKMLNNKAREIQHVVYGIPISCNMLYGKKNNHLETGLGLTYQQGMYGVGINYTKTLFAVARLGYRHQKENGGFFWKIGFTPFFPMKEYGTIFNPNPIIPLLGIGAGYTF